MKMLALAGFLLASASCVSQTAAPSGACPLSNESDVSGTRIAGARIEIRPEDGGTACTTAVEAPTLSDIRDSEMETGHPLVKRSGDVSEFRLGATFVRGESIPDAPSSSKKNALLHGQLYGSLGSDSLGGARDVVPAMQLPLTQFDAALGGPVGSDRTSFFASYDQSGLDREQLLSRLATQVSVGNARMPVDANVLKSTSFVSRMDHRFSQNDAVYLQYSRDEAHGNSLQRDLDASLPAGMSGLNVKQQAMRAGNAVDISPSTSNETRAQFLSTAVQLPAGAGAVGLQSTMPTERKNRVFEAANNVYRQLGSQNLRMGGDFLYNQMNLSFLQSSMGRIAATGPSLSQAAEDAGFYVQSARKVRPDLLVTTGMRYDVEHVRGIRTDWNNFSPQLGLAWSPGASRTVLRVGFGMNYDRTPLPLLSGTDDAAAASLSRSMTIANLGQHSMADYGNFQTVSPSVQNAYGEHVTLEAEQQVGLKSVLSAQYQFVRGVQLALPVQRTVALCATTNACAAGNDFTGQQIGSGAVSTYGGLTVAFTQQPVRWGSYKLAYTYSSAEGTGSGVNSSYLKDQMRRVSFTGVLHTSLDPASDAWQRLTHGFLLAGTTDYLNRSEFLGMNFINLNARLTKNLVMNSRFRLEANAETFNMLQRANSAFTKAIGEMGQNSVSVFAAYTRVAVAQSPNGSRAGFRLSF